MSIAEKLTTIAENEQKVYDAGKKAEYDTFWDSYQLRGTLTNYITGFGGYGWNNTTFKPKYDITPVTGYMMFRTSSINGDFENLLSRIGVKLDCSKLTNSQYMFSQTKITRLGILDFRKVTNGYSTFTSSNQLHTIDKLIFSETTHTSSDYFQGCTVLANLTMEGVIAKSFYLQYCPLTVESMKSVISCLKNYTGTEYDQTYTIRFSEDCWVLLEETTAPDGYDTWKDYVSSLGWLY